MKRCSKCQALLVNQIWELNVATVEASKAAHLEFCTHLCLFEWLRETHGDESALLMAQRLMVASKTV